MGVLWPKSLLFLSQMGLRFRNIGIFNVLRILKPDTEAKTVSRRGRTTPEPRHSVSYPPICGTDSASVW